MPSFKEKFTILVGTIINTDFNKTAQYQFQLEGKEFIDELFHKGEIEKVQTVAEAGLEYGFSNIGLELAKLGLDFSGLILSVFSLYLQIKKNKNDHLKQKIERIDLEKELRDRLIAEKMSEELIDVITTKYKNKIEDLIFEELNSDK